MLYEAENAIPPAAEIKQEVIARESSKDEKLMTNCQWHRGLPAQRTKTHQFRNRRNHKSFDDGLLARDEVEATTSNGGMQCTRTCYGDNCAEPLITATFPYWVESLIFSVCVYAAVCKSIHL